MDKENLKHTKPKVFFKTFGCRTNLFDTQVMMENLKDFILTEDEMDADVIVVNSCTVTNGADAGVRSYVNKINKIGKKVLFTGCGVKTQGKNLFEKSLVFGTFAHSYKEKINDFLLSNSRFFYEDSPDVTHIDDTIVKDFSSKVRAFIKIQDDDVDILFRLIQQNKKIAREKIEQQKRKAVPQKPEKIQFVHTPIHKMSLKELKEHLRALGLNTDGQKADLIKRYENFAKGK